MSLSIHFLASVLSSTLPFVSPLLCLLCFTLFLLFLPSPFDEFLCLLPDQGGGVGASFFDPVLGIYKGNLKSVTNATFNPPNREKARVSKPVLFPNLKLIVNSYLDGLLLLSPFTSGCCPLAVAIMS